MKHKLNVFRKKKKKSRDTSKHSGRHQSVVSVTTCSYSSGCRVVKALRVGEWVADRSLEHFPPHVTFASFLFVDSSLWHVIQRLCVGVGIIRVEAVGQWNPWNHWVSDTEKQLEPVTSYTFFFLSFFLQSARVLTENIRLLFVSVQLRGWRLA